MLRIGGTRIAGFTLLEVMAATAVLSLGIVMIYQAFFVSLDAFNYCTSYLEIGSWANEKIWQVQEELKRLGLSAAIETSGGISRKNRDFEWDLSYRLIDAEAGLYEIDLVVLEQKTKKRIRLLRTAYAMQE